jgi:hypothetical protein
MPRTPLAAVVCIGLLAGCGSGAKTTGTPGSASAAGNSTPARASQEFASLAHTPLTLGPPPEGSHYDAVNHVFLQRLATLLGHYVERQGLHSVNVTCTASVATQATCRASGIRGSGKLSSATVRVSIDRTSGRLSIAVK